MGSSKLIIGVIVVLLAGAGLFVLSGKSADDAMMEEREMMEEDSMTEAGEVMEDEAMMDDDAMMEKESMESGAYQDYSAEKVAAAGSDTVLLFFYAEWCPICRPLDADIRANESRIPTGTSIFKVDFDTEIALRQKYGVTVQHTIVQIDSSGEMVKKWSVMNPQLSVLLVGVQS